MQSGSSSERAEARAAESAFSSLKMYQFRCFPDQRRRRGTICPDSRLSPMPISAVRMPMLERAKIRPRTRPAGVTGDRSP